MAGQGLRFDARGVSLVATLLLHSRCCTPAAVSLLCACSRSQHISRYSQLIARGAVPFGLLMQVTFIANFNYWSHVPLLQVFATNLGATPTQTGLLVSASGYGSLVASLMVGRHERSFLLLPQFLNPHQGLLSECPAQQQNGGRLIIRSPCWLRVGPACSTASVRALLALSC